MQDFLDTQKRLFKKQPPTPVSSRDEEMPSESCKVEISTQVMNVAFSIRSLKKRRGNNRIRARIRNWLPDSPSVSYIQSSLDAAKNLLLSIYTWSLKITKCRRVKQPKCQHQTSHLVFWKRTWKYKMMSAQTVPFTRLGEPVMLFVAPALIYSKPKEVSATL